MSAKEVVEVLVSPITKLIDVSAKGIGKWFEPIHLKRMYKARAEGIKMIESVAQESNLELIITDTNLEINNKEFVERAYNRVQYQELVKQKNIEDVVGLTYNEIKNNENVESQPLSDTWIARFFNSVQDISCVELKQLWAKLLAGEIKKNGSVSLRTMDCLRSLTVDEAKQFEKVAKCALFIPSGDAILLSEIVDNRIVNFDDVLKLEDCGLIKSNTTSLKLQTVDVVGKEYFYNFNKQVNICMEEDKNVAISIYNFTSAGKELINILQIQSNDVSVNRIQKLCRRKDVDFEVIDL